MIYLHFSSFLHIFAFIKDLKDMKICAFSDMHGNLDFKVEPCDIVMICGDIVPLRIQRWTEPSLDWFKNVFLPWCTELPCEKVLFVGGNHDFLMCNHPDRIRLALSEQDKVIFLDCETFEYQGKVIYGTPLCKPFGRWAYMPSYEEQDERYERHLKIIGKIDILMAHDAPYGTSDVIMQKDCPWADGSHIGNESLKKFIEKAQPKVMFHGHLHTTTRDVEYIGETAVHSVSLLDEDYKMVYEPTYLDLE